MNKFTKRTVTVVLAGSFMFSMAATGWAQTTTEPQTPAPAVVQPIQALGVSQMYGTIVNVEKRTNSAMSIEVKPADGGESMIFHVNNETFFIDAMTGAPMDLDKRTTDGVSVYYGPAVTMSIPAQSPAAAVIGNIAEGATYPRYAKVEAVEKLSDGGLLITTDAGSRVITLGKDMPITPFKTKNIVSLADVTVGSELALWYDVMTLSLPAQATADKAVLLAAAEPAEAQEQVMIKDGRILVNGQDIGFTASREAGTDGQTYTMVPARLVAEALGYEVLWSDGTVTVKLPDFARSATYTVGSTSYGVNRMLVNLPAAPINKDGVTYVPLSFFSETLDVTVSEASDVPVSAE